MTRLSRLRELAAGATPGPWHAGRPSRGLRTYVYDAENRYLFQQQREVEPNAAYVAALSPERVLAMIACIEAADVMRNHPIVDGDHVDVYDAARAALEAK